MALYDLPALIDYILKVSETQNLFYIGHSMGSSVFFACLALKPHYNDKIKVMIALAPAVYADNFRNKPIRLIVAPLCSILVLNYKKYIEEIRRCVHPFQCCFKKFLRVNSVS
jgi:pimeloyl-ACP methyl ester carboxylesterase